MVRVSLRDTIPHDLDLTLRDEILPALGLTVTQAAQQFDVSRVALSRVLNGVHRLGLEALLGLPYSAHGRPDPNPPTKEVNHGPPSRR